MSRPDSDGSVSVADREMQPASVLRAAGLSMLVVVAWLLDGIVGGAVGIAIAGVTIVARPIVVAGIAQAGLLMIAPELTTAESLAMVGLFELGVVAILLSEPPIELPTALLTTGFAIVFTTSILAVWVRNGQGIAIGLLLALVALLGYGIHRYERVSLGLVATETNNGASNE